MSSRIDSPFGNLAARVAATRGRGDAVPAEVRLLDHGRWVEFRTDEGAWIPGLQSTWERVPAGAWWGRVVIVDEPCHAIELLVSADRLRPANPHTPRLASG